MKKINRGLFEKKLIKKVIFNTNGFENEATISYHLIRQVEGSLLYVANVDIVYDGYRHWTSSILHVNAGVYEGEFFCSINSFDYDHDVDGVVWRSAIPEQNLRFICSEIEKSFREALLS